MPEVFLPFCRPQIRQDDIDAVVAVLKSGWITTGPQCAALEEEFRRQLNVKHAIAMSSATGAMHCYLAALNIGAGDEVITPSLTWVSTVNLICLLGATPVFVDVDRDNLMTNAEAIAAAITPRTRLIIPVHYAGAALDLDPIYTVADQHSIPIVEDAAHVLGARYKDRRVGGERDAIFSLQAIKNVTGAEGGVFVTNDDALATRVKQLKFHGLGVDAFDRSSQGRRPQAEVLEPGYKYNLPDMCAVLALSQLQRLEEINARRRVIAEFYLRELQDVPQVSPLQIPRWQHHHTWHLFVIRIEDSAAVSRDQFIEAMKDRNIGCGIHFLAVHRQKYYRELLADHAPHLPNTEWNSARICSIPLFPDMELEDAQRVIDAIKAVV